jgi:hypothetical protein
MVRLIFSEKVRTHEYIGGEISTTTHDRVYDISPERAIATYTNTVPIGIKKEKTFSTATGIMPALNIPFELDEFGKIKYHGITSVSVYPAKAYNSVATSAANYILNLADPTLEVTTDRWGDWEKRNKPVEGDGKWSRKDLLVIHNKTDEATKDLQPGGSPNYDWLLEMLYLISLNANRVPEAIAGNGVRSSMASTGNQIAPFLRHIDIVRDGMVEYWEHYFEIILSIARSKKMINIPEGLKTRVVWKDSDRDTKKDEADTLKTVVGTLNAATEGGQISEEEAYDYLSQFLKLYPLDEHKEMVKETLDKLQKRRSDFISDRLAGEAEIEEEDDE